MLAVSRVEFNNILFILSSYNLNLLITYYPNVTSWFVLSDAVSVAVNGSLYKLCLYGPCAHYGLFSDPSIMDTQLLP